MVRRKNIAIKASVIVIMFFLLSIPNGVGLTATEGNPVTIGTSVTIVGPNINENEKTDAFQDDVKNIGTSVTVINPCLSDAGSYRSERKVLTSNSRKDVVGLLDNPMLTIGVLWVFTSFALALLDSLEMMSKAFAWSFF